MNRNFNAILAIFVWMAFFGLGFAMANLYNGYSAKEVQPKPVIDLKEKRDTVTADTQIIHEQKYLRCNHIIITQFVDREILENKTLEQLKKMFTVSNGYSLSLDNNTLIIHQRIDDFCPEDKNKCRLKEFQGLVAVYKGVNAENDVLEKVTSIRMDSLPTELQEKIHLGEWEFKDIDAINDALENLDEYL